MSRQEFAAEKGGRRGPRTNLQGEVARLLAKGLTVQEVAKALGKPSRTIRYHAQKLRGNVAGEMLPLGVPVPKNGKVSAPIYYRVHDWTLSFPLRFVSDAYRRRLKKGNVAQVWGHRVQLFKARLLIRASSGTAFAGQSHEAAFDAGMAYWERFVRLLEDRWKVSLWKRDGQFGVSCESAEVGNDLAGECVKRRDWVRICDPESGKAWALVDASTGPPEFEAVDAVQAGDDMGRVLSPFFNDLRAHAGELPLPSQSYREVVELRQEVQALVASMRALVELERARLGMRESVSHADRVGEGRPWYIQ